MHTRAFDTDTHQDSWDVVLRCNAYESIGYGHFFRSLHLARALQQRPEITGVRFMGCFDAVVHDIATHYQISILSVEAAHCAEQERLYLPPNTLVWVDSYHASADYYSELRRHCGRLVVMDDFNLHDHQYADMVVSFCISAPSYQYNASQQFLGLQYFLCKPELEAIRKRNLKRSIIPSARRACALILIGGCDPHDATAKVVNTLAQAFSDLDILSVHRQLARKRKVPLSNNNQWQQYPLTPEIESLYARADWMVSGGGMSKYEAAYCAIPSVSLANTDAEARETQAFTRANLTVDAGSAAQIDPAYLLERIDFALSAPQRQRFLQHSRDAFLHHSSAHLAERLVAETQCHDQ